MELMLRFDQRLCQLLGARGSKGLNSFVQGGDRAQDPDTLCQWGELYNSGEVVTCSPRFVWDHDGIHELLGPCIFDFERLLVFECFWPKRSQQRDHLLCM